MNICLRVIPKVLLQEAIADLKSELKIPDFEPVPPPQNNSNKVVAVESAERPSHNSEYLELQRIRPPEVKAPNLEMLEVREERRVPVEDQISHDITQKLDIEIVGETPDLTMTFNKKNVKGQPIVPRLQVTTSELKNATTEFKIN